MTMTAAKLHPSHIGKRIHYGPRMTFTGIIADLRHMEEDWFQGKTYEPYTSPPRVFVTTQDGRSATLSHDSPILIEGEST